MKKNKMQKKIRAGFKNGVSFVKNNKLFMLKLGIMAAVVVTSADTAFAQTVTEGTGAVNNMTTLTTPIERMRGFMTGYVPSALVSIGAVMAGAGYTMNIDNQVVKTCMRIGGGGAATIGAVGFINDFTGLVF